MNLTFDLIQGLVGVFKVLTATDIPGKNSLNAFDIPGLHMETEEVRQWRKQRISKYTTEKLYLYMRNTTLYIFTCEI